MNNETSKTITHSILGCKVEDTLTTFVGVCVGRAEFLHDETKLQVQPYTTEGNYLPEPIWLPESRMRNVDPRRIGD